ncbi:transposase [Allopusillimonas soli]|uniref:transposase n=1 Tax=Allopusillimonas soli TaxID=659016 RepID=UPI001ADAFBB8|nr:transposase [Allopusillimonas soli]
MTCKIIILFDSKKVFTLVLTLAYAFSNGVIEMVPKYHCTDCNRYFRHRFAGIRPRRRATEAYRLEVFEAHDGGVSQRQLTRTHWIGSATVERWYQSFIGQRVSELSGRSCPQVLGIDEHFFSRKKGYATTLVDLRHHKVFDVVLGRSEASLRGYLKRWGRACGDGQFLVNTHRDGRKKGLFIIKGGRSAFIKLVFAKKHV